MMQRKAVEKVQDLVYKTERWTTEIDLPEVVSLGRRRKSSGEVGPIKTDDLEECTTISTFASRSLKASHANLAQSALDNPQTLLHLLTIYFSRCKYNHDIPGYLASKPHDLRLATTADLSDTPPFVVIPSTDTPADPDYPSIDTSTRCPVHSELGECKCVRVIIS